MELVTVKINGVKTYGRVLKDYGRFVLVQLDKYRECFLKTDITKVGSENSLKDIQLIEKAYPSKKNQSVKVSYHGSYGRRS
jgi:hypothetical protein